MKRLIFIFGLTVLLGPAYGYLTPTGVNATQIQGTNVSATPPTTNQCLVYGGALWAPGSCAAGGTGITSINTDTTADQLLAVGTAGTDFAIVDNLSGTHTFNLPSASATARGVVTTGTQTLAGAKTFSSAITASGGVVGNSSTATALVGDPTDCGANTFANAIAANGNLTCAAVGNAATTATSANTASAIMARDGSGNVAVGVITATDVKKGSCYVSPKESDIGNSGSSVGVDLSTATTFTLTLNAATPTVTFSNPVAGCAYALVLTQDGTGSRVPTFAGTTVIWGNSGFHTLSTTASAIDKVTCVYNGNITSLMCDLGTAYQ